MMRRMLCCAAAALGLGTLSSPAGEPQGDVYPFDSCPVSDEKFGSEDMGDPVAIEHEGRDIRFCCESCIKPFKKDPARFLAKVDEAIVKTQLPRYPLETCVVRGEKFGKEVEPVDRVYKNRLVRMCPHKQCLDQFTQRPAEYLAKLDKAVIERQKASYPLGTCPVSGEKLGGEMGEPVDFVTGNRLVRFCCKNCIQEFRKEPWKHLGKLEAAAKKGR